MSEEEAIVLSAAESLSKFNTTKRARILKKIAQAALGSIPWVGGFINAATSFQNEEEQYKKDGLQKDWLEEHAQKLQDLSQTLGRMMDRLEFFGDEVAARMESEEYLSIIRKGFSDWDQASTSEKKKLITQLMTNAGISDQCSDDVIKLFQDWINAYHEIHFAVIAEIYKRKGISRGQIWSNIRGNAPREDSSEADLFKLLIRDLSTGGIIRQHRETTYSGDFVKKKPVRSGSGTIKSAFDFEEPYELTELGAQFVHYAMEEIVPRLPDAV